MAEKDDIKSNESEIDKPKRDMVVLAASGVAAFGAGACVLPLVDSMNPAADTQALSFIKQDISGIKPGKMIKVMWQGKPVFVKRRTPEEIAEARETKMSELIDPQEDQDRVKKGKDEWLIMIGVCTHLGCIPQENKGEYDAWFCPCHGSHYDTSGRIRKGPAPYNLEIPPYGFIDDNTIMIGKSQEEIDKDKAA